ncbi:MAG: signal recognition particle protein [Deferribacterales bacterium]
MFATLNDKLNGVFKKLKKQVRLDESNIHEALKMVRMALLEADVNYKVVKNFIGSVQAKALGEEVLKSLTPDQVFIKIVHDELVEILGGKDYDEGKIRLNSQPPTVILMAGLQGSGKTTSAGKLAGLLMKQKRNVLLVAGDIYRPAAIDQLETLGKQLNCDVYADKQSKDAVKIASDALAYAKKTAKDVVIIDTAGRLHIDEELMAELVRTKEAVTPDEILFVADAMTGQDAVNVAKSFNESLEATGIILTKMDGDARGGAALSIKEVTGKPLKFIGTGEKMGEFEAFYPDRMASRILGMGDIVTLVERAQESIEDGDAEDMAEKMAKYGLDFDDMLKQFKMIKKMGSLESIMRMIPGLNNVSMGDMDDKQFKKIEAIIFSMTRHERRNAKILNSGRRKRIAKGSGTSVADVNRLVNQLNQMNKMMKQMKKKLGGSNKLNPAMMRDFLKMR